MGGQWAAIAITVVASTGNNIGKALQKEATRKLPRFSLEPAILVQYVRSRQWLAGLAADLAGALLMIAAFALAPVSQQLPWQFLCGLSLSPWRRCAAVSRAGRQSCQPAKLPWLLLTGRTLGSRASA